MGIVYRAFEKRDFIDLATFSDDEWADKHYGIAFSMLKAEGNIEQCLLAVADEKIVGYIYAFALPNKTLLPELLYVLPQYRQQGIGRKLLAKMETSTECTASMIFYHNSLHKFYSSLGYRAGDNLEVAMKALPAMKEKPV